MRIVILSYWFLPYRIGGSEVVVDHYAKGLAQKGHEVHVITQLDDMSLHPYELVAGFHVHRIKRWHIRIFGTLLYFLLVYRKIKKLKPDIIHEQAIQGLGFFIKKLSNIPYIIFTQGTDLYLTSPTFLKNFIVKSSLKSADVLIGLTQDMAQEMKKFYPRDVVIIPNGVDLDRFRKLSRKDARRELGIKGDKKVILCVANLRAEKGHEYLVEAMESVSTHYHESTLFVVGQDYLKGRIKDLVIKKNLQDRIFFAGFVPPDKLPKYMRAADIFVLPSLREGLPIALLEAMAAGLPIVATNVGGMPEIIKEDENGFLVEPMDSQQLAKKIIFLLQNEDIRKRFSSNNTERAKNYNWSTIVTSLEEVYLQVKRR